MWKIRQARHVGGEGTCIQGFMGHVKERDPLEALVVDRSIILKRIFRKSERCGLD